MHRREHDVSGIAALRAGVGVVPEAAAQEVLAGAEAVGLDRRAVLAGVLDEVQQRLGFHVGHDLNAGRSAADITPRLP